MNVYQLNLVQNGMNQYIARYKNQSFGFLILPYMLEMFVTKRLR